MSRRATDEHLSPSSRDTYVVGPGGGDEKPSRFQMIEHHRPPRHRVRLSHGSSDPCRWTKERRLCLSGSFFGCWGATRTGHRSLTRPTTSGPSLSPRSPRNRPQRHPYGLSEPIRRTSPAKSSNSTTHKAFHKSLRLNCLLTIFERSCFVDGPLIGNIISP